MLYVNSPLDRITSLRNRGEEQVQRRLDVIEGKAVGLVQVADNIWNLYPDCMVESINWLTIPAFFDWINRRNNRRFARSILAAIDKLGFDDYYLFNDNEIIKCFYLTEYLRPKQRIYYSRDYILATPYWKKHGQRLEPLVIAANDLCVANSAYLADYCRQYNANAYDVGQGCDFNSSTAPLLDTPDELRDITDRPIVGYVGALHSLRLDVAIIEHIAISKPEWQLVLVGPEDHGFVQSSLHHLENVLFVGQKQPTELPAYIQRFDVCINPQQVNNLTIGNYPRKVDEYLMMGKPVVATSTRAMECFADFVFLAGDKYQYVGLIERALQTDTPALAEQRKGFARNHTWENSVAAIYGAITEVENRNRK